MECLCDLPQLLLFAEIKVNIPFLKVWLTELAHRIAHESSFKFMSIKIIHFNNCVLITKLPELTDAYG